MLKKLLNIAKVTFQVLLVASLGFFISLGVHTSVIESTRMPTSSEMSSLGNISEDLNSKQSRSVNLSRHSILQVLTTSEKRSGFSKMSGTYVVHEDNYYVITAAHGVVGECEYFFVANANDVFDCIR